MDDIEVRLGELEKQLEAAKDKPKPKDAWDKFSTVTAFLSSVLLAGLATLFTVLYQSGESARRHQSEVTQTQQVAHQNRVRELEAVAKFVPYLTGKESSEESKKLAIIALREFASTNVATQFAEAFPSQGAVLALQQIRPTVSGDERKAVDDALDRIHAAPPPKDVMPYKSQPNRADIATWNLHWFAKNSPAAFQFKPERIGAVADAIVRLDADVLALAEVDGPALEELSAELRKRGHDTAFIVKGVPGTHGLGVLFDARRVKIVDLNAEYDEKFKQELAVTVDGTPAFVRPPLFARVTIREACEPLTFTLIVVHLKSRAGGPRSDKQRAASARALAQIVRTLRSGNPEPVIVTGDFNDTLDSPSLRPLKDSPDLVPLSESKGAAGISWIGSRGLKAEPIDHVFISRDLANRIRPDQFNWKDAPAVRLDQEIVGYRDLISDHLPVVAPVSYPGECVAGSAQAQR